ncbi:unnamed protein product [Pseudo-nitzschia multistriata]|uniref:Uncharacterized protein n=1 Tax=Pseudo-nitzschia multistriata TaxID=183589 RepID=A0A448Z6C5_9STRA|nr:unnamed protein product [Pseudo-nitzschia multistriata]
MADPTDYAIVANENYVSPTYEPPQAFLNVGSALENIVTDRDRGSGDAAPNSILAFVAGDRAEQVEYIEGFVGIGIFLSCMVSIWFLVLLLLKFQGRDRVGCAAGFAFHDADSDTQSAKEERKTRGGASGTLFRGDGQDASVGAAVGADDSIAMDEPEVRKKKASEIEKQERKSSSGIFASVFGRSRDASGNEPRSEPSSPQHKGVVATFKGGRNGRNWSVLRDDTTDYPNPPDSNGNNDNNDNNDNNGYNYDNDENYVPYELEEIELHMELDDIVHSATRASEKKEQKRRNKGKPWSLRSLPPKTVVLENDSNEDDLSIETKLAERENNKACGQTPCCSFDAKDVARRRVATRWVFAVFALISLICCILLITHMYVPLESAALTSKEVVRETSEIVDELNEVLEIVDEAATVTESLLKNTPLEYESLCPGFAVGNFASQFGFNPKTVIDTVVQEYINYIPTIRGLLDTAKETASLH